MERSPLHPPGADKGNPTQFSERETFTDGKDFAAEKIPLDAELNFPDFGFSISRNAKFFLDDFTRLRQVYLIGATGMGKSTILERVVISDINAGRPGMFIDPHGQSAYRVLDSIKRTRKVIYADFSSTTDFFSWNPLAGVEPDRIPKAASDLIAGIKDKFFDRGFGAPRFTYYLRNFLLPLLRRGDATFEDLLRMLSDDDYRQRVSATATDPLNQLFWKKYERKENKKYNADAIEPIANKLDAILQNETVRKVLSQRRPKFSMATAFNEGYFVVVNLAKGQIGDEASSILGSLLVSQYYTVLVERKASTPLPLTADEFQNYALNIFETMLAEGRKKGMMLTLAHQFASQIEEEILDAVLGNAGTVISFRISAKDAKLIAPQLDTNPQRLFSPHVLTQLAPFEAHMRSLNQEREHIETLLPLPTTARAPTIVAESNARFARKV